MKKIIWIVIILIIIWGIVAVVGGSNEPTETGSIKIGALLCLTGACAEWGENSLDGLRLATDEINNTGGVLGRNIELVVQDSSEDNPATSVSAYRQLRLKDIDYIIGPTWTAAGLAIAPIAADDDVIITSPSLGVAGFNEESDNIFNVWPHDDIATRALVRFAFERGLRNAAIFSSKESWYQLQGDAFEDEFTKLGGIITVREEPLLTQRDLKTEALKIKDSNPDVVMYSNFDNMGIMAKELRTFGYTGEQMSILMDESRINQAQGAFEDAIYVQYDKPKQSFIDSYKARFGKEPGITADTAYDALYIYAKIISDTGTDNLEKVKKTYLKIKLYSGVSGELTFDGKGGVTKPPVFWMVKDGKSVKFE